MRLGTCLVFQFILLAECWMWIFGTIVRETNHPSDVAEQPVSSPLLPPGVRSWPTAHVPDTCPCHRGRVPADSPTTKVPVVDRFHRFCVAVVERLPFRLNSVVAPTFLGFALINGCTFGVDLLLLTALHGWLLVPVPIAVTLAYACAFTLSYFLNRTVNFQSHAPVGPQFTAYAAVVTVNYLAFILGVSSVLTALGLDFRIARFLAGCCEAIYMYCAMRWLVFRR
jgi:putative flippase GtrA